jgi:hypothetical protein
LNRTIEVIISPQGESKIQTKGFAGVECQQTSECLEKALGQRQVEQLTAEFYHEVTAALPNRQQT